MKDSQMSNLIIEFLLTTLFVFLPIILTVGASLVLLILPLTIGVHLKDRIAVYTLIIGISTTQLIFNSSTMPLIIGNFTWFFLILSIWVIYRIIKTIFMATSPSNSKPASAVKSYSYMALGICGLSYGTTLFIYLFL